MRLSVIVPTTLLPLFAAGICLAQQPLCIPGTTLCARAYGNGGVQASGAAQGRVDPNGARGNVQGNAGANSRGNAAASTSGNGNGTGGPFAPSDARYSATPMRFGVGLNLCGTVKAGVLSGLKGGPCFAVSFRTERLTFEMESQLLVGGVRHSVDWVFPMSFVVPLTSQRSLYEGLALRVGGSPIGVTFARWQDGGNYIRFGLHAGLSYELGLSDAITWRIFDARAFLDFGTRREVDLHHDFLDFGGQLSTGVVF